VDPIIKFSQISALIKKIHQSNQKIILVGGCFDLVHLGHLIFLQKAKSKGSILIVLLESDQTIKHLKGKNRPINSQINRANFLTHLKSVDFIVLLPEMKNDQDYQDLISKIHPDIIAVTRGDSKLVIKKSEARSVGAKLLIVTNSISNQSTSLFIKKCYNTNQEKI
jgi:FAD synthetase